MNNQKKRIIGVILVLTLILGIALFFGNRKTDMSIANRKSKYINIETDSHGNWSSILYFTSNSNNVVIEDDQLTYSSNSDSLADNEIVMHIDTTLYHDTATFPIENAAMAYYIDVPSIFFTYIAPDGYTVDTDNNMVLFNENNNDVGYIKFGSEMTFCDYFGDPTACENESAYHWFWDEAGLVIFNGTEISAVDSDYTVGINVTYAFDSNYSSLEDEVSIPAYIMFYETDEYDYDPYTVYFESIAGETVDLSNITAAEEVEYTSWQSEWGTESGTHNYYLLYNVYGDFSYSSNYVLAFLLENNEGELLAYSSDGINYENGNYNSYVQNNGCVVEGIGDTSVSCYMVLGFNVTDEDLQTSVKITVTAGQPPKMTNKSFQFNHLLKATNTPDDPEYPAGVNKGFTEKNLTVQASEGAINKLLNGSSVNYTWLIEPTAVTINNGNKAFNLWELTNGGTNPYTVSISSGGERLDSVYDGEGDFYELNGNDYSIVSFYPQKDAEYDYVLDGNNYVLTEVTNVSDYTPKQVYVKVNSEGFEPYGSYVKTSSGIVYSNLQGETQIVNESNPIVLPSNTTEVKVSYTGTRAAVYLGINVSTTVNGTDAVKNKINALGANGFDNAVVLKNYARASFGDEESVKVASTYLSKLEVSSYSVTTSTNNGRIESNTADSISYVDKFYEQMNYTEENKNEVLNSITEQTKADVYELLPSGAELDGSVVVKTIDGNSTCSFNSDVQENYQGTGRVLVTLSSISCEGQNIKDTGTSIQTGYIIEFNIKYNNVAKQSYGTTLYKDAMFYGYQTLGNGYSSAEEAPNGKFSSDSVKAIFDGLVTGNNNLLFTTKTDEVDPLSISIGTFSKTVSSESEDTYSSETTVVEGTTYTYKLQYAFTSQLEEITNVIIIDKIEADYGDNENFKGYLDSIDTSYLESLGITPTIYYATSDVTTNAFNIAEWSTIMPSDVEDIKAIAVDCGSYRFVGNSSEAPLVYIKMVATQKGDEDVAAYNKASIVYKNVGDTSVKTLASEITKVNLNGASLKIDGTSNYGKGSQDDPAEIEEELIYTITVTNEDQVYTYKDIEVEVTIPESLSAIDYDQNGNKVTLNIPSLEPGKSQEFNIELMSNELPSGDKVFVGSYKIVKLNINPYESETGYIYNQILFPDLDIHKYVKTSDTQSFTDEADVIVKSGEEFSYRITVTNDADVAASNVVVVDTVPAGLNIVNSSIGNGTVTDNTIKWTVNVAANSSVNIDYKVKLDSSASLGTTYRSSANVTLYNPFDRRVIFYQEDTNEVSVLYQIVTNLKVTTTLDGALADPAKVFAYEVTFTGSPSNAGTYTVINNKNEQLPSLTIDAEGNGTYSFTSKDGESVTFKNLSGGITFNVEVTENPGYSTSVNDVDSTQVYDRNYCPGSTDTEGTKTCAFAHQYSASGTAKLNARVTYEKGVQADMFKVTIDNKTYDVPASGEVESDEITYTNTVDQQIYVIKQVNTGVSKVSYDTSEYKAVVNITNDGNGNLNTDITYYDKNDKAVDEVVFNNTYLPNGLTIKNVNSSEYVDNDKLFEYEITLTNGDGTYEVKDSKGNNLSDIVFENGEAHYSINLISNEYILISDLPDGVEYVIKQKLVDYYETTTTEQSTKDDDYIIVSGVTEDASKEIVFDNNYETKASFTPEIGVILEGKELENEEFIFKITDVSSGSTNGYTDTAKNDADGTISFKEIDYSRPGTYKYEIVQLSNGSNHIYFDYSKVLLTIELSDSGDGTMEVLSTYTYENSEEHLINKYSEEPIVVEPEPENPHTNPNTNDRVRNIVVLLLTVIVLFIIERWVRYRRYSMNS